MPSSPKETTSVAGACADVTGVILAGGRSRRMGQDKATLVVDGERMIERTLRVIRPLFSRILIAGDRPDLASATVPAIPDRYPGSALGGIHGGLAAAETPWIFVLPCDLPYPDASLIRRMLDCRPGFEVVIPPTAHGLEPVFALYHKNSLPLMEGMLQRGEYRILDLFPRLPTCYLDLDVTSRQWQRALLNLNTPQDLSHLKEDPD